MINYPKEVARIRRLHLLISFCWISSLILPAIDDVNGFTIFLMTLFVLVMIFPIFMGVFLAPVANIMIFIIQIECIKSLFRSKSGIPYKIKSSHAMIIAGSALIVSLVFYYIVDGGSFQGVAIGALLWYLSIILVIIASGCSIDLEQKIVYQERSLEKAPLSSMSKLGIVTLLLFILALFTQIILIYGYDNEAIQIQLRQHNNIFHLNFCELFPQRSTEHFFIDDLPIDQY